MKTEIADKWIAALNSGQYEQSIEHLKDSGGFCCLGVLTDLYNKETGRGEWENDVFIEDGIKEYDELPINVKEWCGMKTSNGSFYTENLPADILIKLEAVVEEENLKYHNSLVEFNDDCGLSFTSIAQVIEILKDKL